MSALIERIGRHPIAFILGALVLIVVAGSTFTIVPEGKQAVVLRFGEPVRIFNRYRPGQSIGHDGAGLKVRMPFVDRVMWIDKRILSVEMESQQVSSSDQNRLQVDAFARFRIVDPLRMVVTAQNSDNVALALRTNLGSALRTELGKRPFDALLSPERGQLMDNIQVALNRFAQQYGAEIVDVRIKRADLPAGSPLESALNRMRSARQQEAYTIEAQGLKNAQIIRAEADAQATKIYADAFNKDPSFYNFYRAMQSYQLTFIPSDDTKGGTSIILSPDNAYLREFQGGGR